MSGSDRGILQGYFLNIANPTNNSLRLRLRFNAQSPNIDRSKLLVIRDTGGSNDFANLTAQNTYDFRLAAGDTGLVILQPDIRNLDPTNVADRVEIRGYVEIFVVGFFPFPFRGRGFQLLATPEHRGTFLPNPGGSGEFDQLISSLPTMSGGSLINVDTVPPFPIPFPNPPVAIPDLQPIPDFPVIDNGTNSNGASSIPAGDPQLVGIQQLLSAMADQIDDINQRLPQEAEQPVS
ncbi:hypothetical protein [Vasconcelosia minhoensis]|uniref:hypothetical protein n=1 Tax=Vasconcelosia minhoensis TaxID=3366354 RepID=UPI001D13AE77|nr:hypothetical protein [Romeria gracilis]